MRGWTEVLLQVWVQPSLPIKLYQTNPTNSIYRRLSVPVTVDYDLSSLPNTEKAHTQKIRTQVGLVNINLGLQGNTKNYLASTTKKPNVPFSSIFISRIPFLLEEHLCPQTSSQWFKQLKWFYATFSIIKIYFASFVFQGICWNQDSPSNRMFAKVTGLRQKWKATQYHRQKDFRIT